MKVTVVTGSRGKLVALVYAHLSEHDRSASYAGGPHATLRPMTGQKFHELEAPDEYEKRPSAELRRWAIRKVSGGSKKRR
jgi:hypothetical protein